MTDNPETPAYLVSLEAYWAGAERGKNDPSAKNQPKPPNADVACEVAVLCSKSIAALLDYQKTDKLRADWEPSPESQLEAAAIIQRQQEKDAP